MFNILYVVVTDVKDRRS